jgi:hypothetical protein
MPGKPLGDDGHVGRLTFRARLQLRAAAIVLDDAQVAVVGAGTKRLPVVATLNGYRATAKEYARWIAEAKQEQRRQRRVQQALEMIRGRQGTPVLMLTDRDGGGADGQWQQRKAAAGSRGRAG